MPPEKETEQAPVQETKQPIKSLRTYQGDVEEAISKHNLSTSSILIAEQKRKAQTAKNPETQKNLLARNSFFVISGSIMLVLGIITVSTILYVKSREQVSIQQKTKTLIGFSEEKIIPVGNDSREKFITNILTEKQSFNLPANSVLYINTTNASSTPIDTKKFLSLLAPKMPASLIRSFGDEYMLGIYSFDNNSPFIVLVVDDFASSFSGMLKWEKDMVSDLGELFSIPQHMATTTVEFKDEALQNKDLRVLQDDNGTVLLYSFINKETLIIATNENILTAIIGKYNISKQNR